MLISPSLFVAAVVAVLGVLILWSNPGRTVNRLICSCSFHIGAWLFCLYMATNPQGSDAAGLFWFRNVHAVSASLPLHLMLVKEAIISERISRRFLLTPSFIVMLLVTAFFSVLPLTNQFIPAGSTSQNRLHAWGFNVKFYAIPLLYGFIFFDAIRSLKRLNSARRIELQVWLLGGCATAAAIMLLEAIYLISGNLLFVRFQPFAALVLYIGTAYAITTARVFDARQIFNLFISRLILVGVVAGFAYFLDRVLILVVANPAFALLLTTGLALGFAAGANRWLNSRFNLFTQATEARKAAHLAAHNVSNADQLADSFRQVLRSWGKTEEAVLMLGSKGRLEGSGIELDEGCSIIELMRELKWATPERLARERPTPDRETLSKFLDEHKLGVLVIEQGTALTVMVGVGIPATRRPFTYPQVTELMELASIIESAFERVHYSMKAQHAEQLATVGMLGAGLAHEIRNPLVTIKTFVQLLPDHFAEETFRTKFFRLINDEVSRIDRLTEQLLDLASPRAYHAEAVALHPLLRNSLELVAAKAADRNIRILVDFAALPDIVLTDGAAARQVLLNLALNAIHAVETVTGERWIRASTRNVPGGIELAVSDNGPGIASEILPRLFQPFQSTKSSGFGLGLAICSEILSGLNATISADPPRQGQGATFRVIFPCPPPLS